MDLTIIIVNWNGGELLLRCLDSIAKSQMSFAVHTIVVDNNSSDGSREAASSRFPEFQIINSGSNLRFGKGNNFARPLVRTPLVLFLNPDTELAPDTLEKSVRCLLSRPEVGALGCKMLYPGGTVQQQGLQWFPNPWTIFLEIILAGSVQRPFIRSLLPSFDPNVSGYVRKLYGGFVLGRKEVLDKAGWFDDRYFMYAEDVDLSQTILNLGWKLYYTAETSIIHVTGGSSDKAPSGFSIVTKNESINKLMEKYYGKRGAWMHRFAVCSGSLLRLSTLVPFWILSAFMGRTKFKNRMKWAMQKQNLMVRWSLGYSVTAPATRTAPNKEPIGVPLRQPDATCQ